MHGLSWFWNWLLKYSAFLVSGVVSIAVAWYVDRFVARRAKLIYYVSHPQWVVPQAVAGQPQIPAIETFSLFLFNQGRAPAREVHVGHFFLPSSSVFPDIPRDIVQTPGGGVTVRFPVVPPKTLIAISYLVFGNFTVDQIVSYVGSEEGAAQRIPVMLQRVFSPWTIRFSLAVYFLGLWLLVNLAISLIHYLWVTFYR